MSNNIPSQNKKIDWLDAITFLCGGFFFVVLTKRGFFDQVGSLWGVVISVLVLVGLMLLVKLINWAPKWVELAIGGLLGFALALVLLRTDGGTKLEELSNLVTPVCVVGLVLSFLYNVSHNRPFRRMFKNQRRAPRRISKVSDRLNEIRSTLGRRIGGETQRSYNDFASGRFDRVTGNN